MIDKFIPQKTIIALTFLFVTGCAEKKYKAYDNYFLGEHIKDDTVFKAQTMRIETSGNQNYKYYARLEKMPTSVIALLSFNTIDETLTDIALRFGKPDYRSVAPEYQINGFTDYCAEKTKVHFINFLRSKYGQETDSSSFSPGINSVTTLEIHKWDFKTHTITLTYRVDNWKTTEQAKYLPENFINYDQAEHNKLWIEYSLRGNRRQRLEESAKRKILEAQNKF